MKRCIDTIGHELKADNVNMIIEGGNGLTVYGDEILLVQAISIIGLLRCFSSEKLDCLIFTIERSSEYVNIRVSGEAKGHEKLDFAGAMELEVPKNKPAKWEGQLDFLKSFRFLVPKAIADFHRGELRTEGSDLVLVLPLTSKKLSKQSSGVVSNGQTPTPSVL